MKIQQLTIFLENKPGRLLKAYKALAENGISLLTLSLADTKDFGLLRLIIKDNDKAIKILEEIGYATVLSEVLAVEITDRPGALLPVLNSLADNGINLEYTYAFAARGGEKAVFIIRVDDAEKAIDAINKNGCKVLTLEEFLQIID